MCLITTYGKGFIASKDIVVYKQLKKRKSDWYTPCRDWEVSLDSMLIPHKSSPEITEYPHNNCKIEGGVIYSYSRLEDIEEGFVYFKAIIPEGTRFWIQDNLREVASERLYITSEKVDKESETDFSSLLSEYCLDLLLNNGERVKWSSDVNPGDVKGMFVYDSQAIGLKVCKSISFSDAPLPNFPRKILDRGKAEKDFSGKERTKYLRENYPDIEILKDLPEDSYLPSLGELSRALENFLFINLTRKALGLKTIGYGRFWSSTPHDDSHGWCVDPYWGWDWDDWLWSFWRDYHWCWDWDYVLSFLIINRDLPLR